MGDEVRAELYQPLLTLHGGWRWVVLAAALAATVSAFAAWLGPERGAVAQARTARLFVLAADIQLALGLALYLFVSPVTRGVFAGAPTDSETGFFAFEHAGAMLFAVVFAHAGKVAASHAPTPARAGRTAALLFAPALALLLLATPWWRPLLRL